MSSLIRGKLRIVKYAKQILSSGSGATCYSKCSAAAEPAESNRVTNSTLTPKVKVETITPPPPAPAAVASSSPLTDKFGRHHTYLRISLTERCNLRCEYCMPAEGVPLQPKSNLLTTDEIYYLARIFVEQGVRKIRLTGGEPTVRRDIVEIIEKIKNIPKIENVGITTNGLVLTRLLLPMQRAGLDSVNISLDTLRPERFEKITRRRGWERVIAGIDLAIQLGYKPKVNCVLMRNFNEDEICDFVEFTKDRNVDIRFIEYMPFSGNKWQTDRLISYNETLATIRKTWPEFQALPNGPNDTSKAYSVPGYSGQVGFITSMTEHFCGSCNRLRLTADGNIKVCLFGNKEFSLRDAIRNQCSEDDLVALISAAVKRKKKQHAETNTNVPHKTSSKAALAGNQQKLHLQLRHGIFSKKQHFINSNKNNIIVNQSHTAIGDRHTQLRNYCSNSKQQQEEQQLTHVDAKGKATMVDVSTKLTTTREAYAVATVEVGAHIAQLIHSNTLAKGDVLSVAQIAGILGAKKTSELIPLCHNIALSSVKVSAKLDHKRYCVRLEARVRCVGQTGVEMEALTAVAVAALTVYDMCKAVSHDITIRDIRLWSKSGGKRDFKRSDENGNDDGISPSNGNNLRRNV